MKRKQSVYPYIRRVHKIRPVSNFRGMILKHAYIENEIGRDFPITVGILIADYRRSFCKENIVEQVERLNRKSGPLIDFYLPGYTQITGGVGVSEEQFKLNGSTYSFSRREFDRFVDELERKGIKVTGRAQLLLVPYENRRFYFRKALNFDLEKDEATGKFESTKLFFDFIIEISRKTTEFDEFRKRIKLQRKGFVFLNFFKEELPSLFFSLLTSPFTK